MNSSNELYSIFKPSTLLTKGFYMSKYSRNFVRQAILQFFCQIKDINVLDETVKACGFVREGDALRNDVILNPPSHPSYKQSIIGRYRLNKITLNIEYDKITFQILDDVHYEFAKFKNAYTRIISSLLIGEIAITRIGLRYVNVIPFSFLKEDMFELYIKNFIENTKDIKNMSRAIMHLEYGDGQYRIIKKLSYTNVNSVRHFLIDYDVIRFLDSLFVVSASELEPLVEASHNYINQLFEEDIKDDFRRLLNGR